VVSEPHGRTSSKPTCDNEESDHHKPHADALCTLLGYGNAPCTLIVMERTEREKGLYTHADFCKWESAGTIYARRLLQVGEHESSDTTTCQSGAPLPPTQTHLHLKQRTAMSAHTATPLSSAGFSQPSGGKRRGASQHKVAADTLSLTF
jgi:hypothetical protein